MTQPALSSNQFYPPLIETVRIVNVNIEDWSVDVISEFGDKKYLDIQVSNMYFHYMNGEGVYVMPEVGALAWVCRPSDGRMATPFLMGFQAPRDDEKGNFKSNRSNLNPGDIMMKTRDENFVILRRGGIVQIGATPTAQRVYIPVRNFIKDFCENYGMFNMTGEMTWEVQRDEEKSTKFSLKVKEKATDKSHIAEMTVGSHGVGDQTTLKLLIKESGSDTAVSKVTLAITKDGNVTWDIKNNLSVTVGGNVTEKIYGDRTVNVTKSNTVTSTLGTSLKSDTTMRLEGIGEFLATTAGMATLNGDAMIKLGTVAPHPVTWGDVLTGWLIGLVSALCAGQDSTQAPLMTPGPNGPVPLASILSPMIAPLSAGSIFSKQVFTK